MHTCTNGLPQCAACAALARIFKLCKRDMHGLVARAHVYARMELHIHVCRHGPRHVLGMCHAPFESFVAAACNERCVSAHALRHAVGDAEVRLYIGCVGDVDRILSFSHVGHATTNYGHVKNGHSMNMHGGASPSSFSDKGALVQ